MPRSHNNEPAEGTFAKVMKALWWILTLPFQLIFLLTGLLARIIIAAAGLSAIALGTMILVNDVSIPLGVTLMIAGILLFWRAIW